MLMMNISMLLVTCLTLQKGEGWLFSRRSNSAGSRSPSSSSRSDSRSDSSWSSLSRRFSLGSRGSSSRMWSRTGFMHDNDDLEPISGLTRSPLDALRNSLREESSESLGSQVNRHMFPNLVRGDKTESEVRREFQQMQREVLLDLQRRNRDRERELFRERFNRITEIDDIIARHDAMCSFCMSLHNQGCVNSHCSTVTAGDTIWS